MFTIDRVKASVNGYGVAVQYNGASGKVYANAAGTNTNLIFDLPTANTNYNFMVMFWV